MTYQQYKELQIATHGIDSFNPEPHNLNIFGIRSANLTAGKFDDIIGCAFISDGGLETLLQFPATTDPGLKYLKEPINVKGTGILAPGFYKNMWKAGLHKGYEAFIQYGNAKAYRDTDRDNQLDFTNLQIVTPDTRCDLHRAWDEHIARENINYSAMCQIPQNDDDYETLIYLRDKQISAGFEYFNYTLWFDLRMA